MGLLGFESDNKINDNVRTFIIVSYALIPIILKIFSAYLLLKFKLQENDLQKIQKKIYG